MASRAELFLQELFKKKARAFTYLERLAATSQSDENEWRDFKSAGFVDAPILSGADQAQEHHRRKSEVKKVWSENLGAFANSSGGILIWGIKTKGRFADGLDLAIDAPALSDRLLALANDATDPPVPNVQVHSITQPKSKTGFVICFIPASTFAPHRSLWAEREFYFRVGDSNRTIPTALLRRMFYPQTSAHLLPLVSATMGKNHDRQWQLGMTVNIVNKGTASARAVCIQVVGLLDRPIRCYAEGRIWSPQPLTNGETYECQSAIHPDQTVSFLNNLTTFAHYPTFPKDEEIFRIRFNIFAQDAPAMMAEVSFSGLELYRGAIDVKPVVREAVAGPQIV